MSNVAPAVKPFKINTPPPALSKHLGTAKALGGSGAGANGQLAAWFYNEAMPFWQALQNGTATATEFEKQQLVQWMNWAKGQLEGGGFSSDFGDLGHDSSEPSVRDDGGFLGPNGGWIYNHPNNEANFDSDGVSHIWGNFELNVAMLSANVTVEYFMDDSVNPPEKAAKIVVKDSDNATGFEHVYIVHGLDDGETINIRTPNQDQVTDMSAGQVTYTWEKFTPHKPDDGSKPEASQDGRPMDGEPVEGADDTYYYQADDMQSRITFNPPAEGPDKVYHVVGLWEINAPLNADIEVDVSDIPEYDTMITVTMTDANGETVKHTYYVRDDFKKGRIFGVPGNITYPGYPDLEEGEVPERWEDIIEINPGLDGASDDYDTEFGPDPDSVDGDTAKYTNQTNIDIRVNPDDDIRVHEIWVSGEAIIRGFDYSNLMRVGYDPETHTWTIDVYSDEEDSHPERFIIHGGENTKVILDVLGEGSLRSTTDEAKASVQIGLDGESPQDVEETEWPPYAEFVTNLPESGQDVETLTLANLIDQAGRSGDSADWQKVKDYLNNQLNDKIKNDWVRSIVTALFTTAGSDHEELDNLLKLIPEDVRRLMYQKLMQVNSEKNEIDDGDMGTSAQIAAKIQASLDKED